MSCGICLGNDDRRRFVERSLVEGVPHTAIEARSRELGFPVKRETIRRHVKVCLTAEARAKSEAGRMLAAKRWTKKEVVKVEADAPPPPTTTAIAPPDLPDSDDFAVLVKARAVQMLKSGDLKVSTQDGLNPSAIVLDESHAQTFALHDVLKSAQGARKNPLLACPTTAGYDMLSVGYALRTTVCKVLEQIVSVEHLLGFVYTLDEGDDWRDERVWIKANPMIWITPTLDWVRSYCADAQATPGLEGEFRVKVCSEWLNAAARWLNEVDA